MKYCFLDLETTGLDARKDSIIEVSFLIRDEKGKISDQFDEVTIPERSPLTKYITHITGITEKEILKRGKHFPELLPKIKEKIGDTIIVGHNIDFDLGFLRENGIDLEKNGRIDTHELARILLVNEESYALEILSEKYGFSHTDAHRAMSDVEACVELFTFLQKKIASLPLKFLQTVRPALEKKTNWIAKKFFLESVGDPKFSFMKSSQACPKRTEVLAKNDLPWGDVSAEHSLFVQQGDSLTSADFLIFLAHKFVAQEKKVLIISPKLDFFLEIKKFPIPDVLLDPKLLPAFTEKRQALTNAEIVFYLQCSFRQSLNFRGADRFDLFTEQRQLWNEIRVQNETSPIFQKIIAERAEEKILIISPNAFFRFRDLPLFRDRILLIDETEIFATKLLFAPAQEHSLLPFLQNEKTSVAAQFFVRNVCHEIVESNLQHALTPYPEKILLSPSQRFPALAEAVRNVSPELEAVAEFLEKPKAEAVRWIQYEPETSNVTFGLWEPGAWRELKASLANFPKVFFHRTPEKRITDFLKIFVGTERGTFVKEESLSLRKKLIVPLDLESASDPQFNESCAEKIIELGEKSPEGHWLAINFSSLETLKKIFSTVSDHFLDREDVFVLGEKVSGGDNKLLELLKRQNRATPRKKVILFTQKLLTPEITALPIKTLVMQKFPFPAPHPLLKELETVAKRSGQNFWGMWIVPQVMGNLSRRASLYPHAENIVWLDPRENATWGKEMLKGVF